MEPRPRPARAPAVRVHDRVPHHLSELHDRARRLHRNAAKCSRSPRARAFPRIARFWTKIFAVSFGMGVVSGRRAVLPVRHQLEPLLGRRRQHRRPADGLRGADRVLPRGDLSSASCCSARTACRAGCMMSAVVVAAGTSTSAFWILAANSWMQTPGRPRDARRRRLSARLARHHLQSELSLPLRAHAHTRPISPPRSWCWRSARAISSPAAISTRRAPCCGWRSACSRSWRRCSSSSATSTGSTRWSTSRSRSPPWRRTGTAASRATSCSPLWPDEEGRRSRFAISIPHGASILLTHDPDGLFPA